ncbi:cell wall-binding repeat-containing protein [Clostridium sp. WLY-B-L2]|uniref:Cell wall-binding repeat-containing protein n=1 Tax=Clostridium aromativorans TaxID=2836848 RepID=A0ABS8NAD2_9CLOT|nr:MULTISPECIES: cell wall-binding repeat-containing protein [Clostridium]KAA8666791.1 cell wall-binding repeat-containing protein [Clostridium sp. HV4-5-A1G]MCC9296764.1 cell wall-binding repeat-containing protein [Clostridium aromativorans]
MYADDLVASAIAGKYSAPLILVDGDDSAAISSSIEYIKNNTTLRVYFYFVPLNDDENLEIKEPKIDEFKRNGFTVVEWGGICP